MNIAGGHVHSSKGKSWPLPLNDSPVYYKQQLTKGGSPRLFILKTFKLSTNQQSIDKCLHKLFALSIVIKDQSRYSASFSFFTSGLVTNLVRKGKLI